jgi:hypothetical protein
MTANPSTWMTDNYDAIQNKPFQQITVFGSHDSGMSTLVDVGGSPPGAGGIAQAQTLSIYDQIVSAGVRYLDIRPVLYQAGPGYSVASGYYAAHYQTVSGSLYVGFLGQTLPEILDQLAQAVAAIGAKDILIIEISHGSQLIDGTVLGSISEPLTASQLDAIANSFINHETLASYLYKIQPTPSSPPNFWALTPSDIVAAGAKIFIFAGADTATSTNGGPVFPKLDCANYYNSWDNSATDDPDTLIDDLTTSMEINLKTSQAFLLAYHCSCTIGGTLEGDSLAGLANTLNPMFMDSLATWCSKNIINQSAGLIPAIVTADWVRADAPLLLEACIGMTFGQYSGFVNQCISAQTSGQGPSMAWLNGTLYLAWTGADEKLNLMSSTDGGLTFGNQFPPPQHSSQTSAESPSLCVANGILYIAWTGADSKLNVATVTVDGTQVTGFSTPKTYGETTDFAPALAWLNGTFYLAWTGTDEKLNIMWTSDIFNTPPKQYPAPAQPSQRSLNSPTLSAFGNDLYIGWTGTNSMGNIAQVALSESQVTNLINVVYLTQESAFGPALASVGGQLYFAWVGSGNKRLNLISSPDGQNFSGQYTSRQTSVGTPGLCSSDQNLYCVWTGDQVNVVQYKID